MPVRGEEKSKKLVADRGAHDGVDNKLLELAKEGASYLRYKKEDKKLKADIAKTNKKIKEGFENEQFVTMNGKHKEIIAPLGDGVNEILLQLQARESVKTVPNIIELLRKKVGADAESYIMSVEVLHESALKSLLNSGLITNQDLLDWTTTDTTYALNVFANKKKE